MAGKNRGDIANRPVTRSYRAQLLAKDAPQNQKKLLPASNKPASMKPEAAPRVTKITPGTVEEENTKPESLSSTQSSLIVRSNALKRKGADNNKLVQPKKKASMKPEPAPIVIKIKPQRQSSTQSAWSDNRKYIKPKEQATVIKIRQDTVEEKTKPSSSSSSSSSGSILTTLSEATSGLNYKPKYRQVRVIVLEWLMKNTTLSKATSGLIYKPAEQINRHMESQVEINRHMRGNVIDWLIQVHSAVRLTRETLYLTINLFDRFLAAETPSTDELQCVGASAMLNASAYLENCLLKIALLANISGAACQYKDVVLMMQRILGRLEWNFTVPTPYEFLTRFIKAAVISSEETTMENMVHFYAELGMREYEITRFSPSMVAAAAVYAARATMKKDPIWHETLEIHTGFTEMQVMDCAKMMVRFHYKATTDKEKNVIYSKYSSDMRSAVALFPPSKDLSAKTTFI